jgi:multidrug efflux pump subunit AcrA (membrane-fusion protein)
MYGRAKIPTGTTKRILIPAQASWDREGLRFVFALDKEGIARLRIVPLGERSGDKVEVLSGLAVGDQIVVGSRDAVRDGAKIKAMSL